MSRYGERYSNPGQVAVNDALFLTPTEGNAAYPSRLISGLNLDTTEQTGNLLFTRRVGGTPTTAALLDGQARFTPLIVAKTGAIDQISFRTTVAAAGPGTANLGLYASHATTRQPTGTPIADFGAVDLTVAPGAITTAGTTPALGADWLYWLCLTSFGYTPTQATLYAQSDAYPFVAVANTTILSGGTGWTQTIASAVLPTVGTIASATSTPTYTVRVD